MAQRSIERYLAEHGFFAGMAEEFVDFLAAHAVRRDVDEDEVLFRYGMPADRFYLLCTGQVTVEVSAIQGPPLELRNLEPDEVLGWSWLIWPYKWHFQARAVAPSQVLEFDGAAILQRCETDPAFGYELIKRFSGLMSERLSAAREKMMDEWHPPGFA